MPYWAASGLRMEWLGGCCPGFGSRVLLVRCYTTASAEVGTVTLDPLQRRSLERDAALAQLR
jgi:hypothetical protein